MEEEKDVSSESSTEEVVEEVTPTISEDEKTPTTSAPKSDDKTIPYERFKEINDELRKLKAQVNNKQADAGLDIDEIVMTTSALKDLDRREQEKALLESKLTGRKVSDVISDEDYKLWQSAYRSKVEKEQAALKPSNKQLEQDRPKSLAEQVAGSDLKTMEDVLTKAGLYKDPRGGRNNGTNRFDMGK
jgi:hypothetical protein